MTPAQRLSDTSGGPGVGETEPEERAFKPAWIISCVTCRVLTHVRTNRYVRAPVRGTWDKGCAKVYKDRLEDGEAACRGGGPLGQCPPECQEHVARGHHSAWGHAEGAIGSHSYNGPSPPQCPFSRGGSSKEQRQEHRATRGSCHAWPRLPVA